MNEHENEVELATSNIPSYQRRTQSGKVVTVRGYVRTDNSAVADRAKASPGRPGTAASGGRFPSDRSLPLFPDAGKSYKNEQKAEKVEYEGIEETGVVDQDALDRDVPVALEILPNLPQNPAMKKLISILKGLSSVSLTEDPAFDPEVVELAKRGIVRVKGYTYISKKTGKLVRVNPYDQMRRLITSLGGTEMAARKGITPDLIDRAMPGFDMKNKAFKKKAPDVKVNTRTMRKSKANVAIEVNEMRIDRQFDVPAPKAGEDFMSKAMSPQHPLASVRNSLEGSQVRLGKDSWVRGMDGKWYKTPRRTANGITDRELTKRIAAKGGRVELAQGDPVQRKEFGTSKVDFDSLNPNSVNYAQAVRYTKSLEQVYRNMPEGVADSLTGNLEVRREAGDKDKDYTSMIRTTATRANKHYPKLVVNPNPEFEKDLIKALPKQQAAGYSVPSTLHPLETSMAFESARFTEKLFETRAPSQMTERMYDRMNRAYDKVIKKDDGDYSGLSGKEGWIARLTGDRSEELSNEISEKLSMSALDSPETFLAEAWTEFVGHPSPRDLSRAIAEEFQNTMVEFSDYLFKNNWVDATEIPEKTFERTTKKSLSRKVSDAIEGATEEITEENLAPRDIRSVIQSSSRYLDIRDDNGNPMFDARVRRDGDTANIASLSYPLTRPSTQPNGIPDIDVDLMVTQDGAIYFHTGEELLKNGKVNQKRYSDFINQEKALLAIEAVEEAMFSEGVRRFEIDTRAGEDSILYARAGYIFDPNDTEVHEIQTIIGDIKDALDGNESLIRDGYFPVPKKAQRSMRTKINKWEREMTADPATWPTPQEIAQIGKTQVTGRSIGESALDAHSWSGVKTLRGDKYNKRENIDLKGSYEELTKQDYKDSIVENKPSASVIASAAAAISTPTPKVSVDKNLAAKKDEAIKATAAGAPIAWPKSGRDPSDAWWGPSPRKDDSRNKGVPTPPVASAIPDRAMVHGAISTPGVPDPDDDDEDPAVLKALADQKLRVESALVSVAESVLKTNADRFPDAKVTFSGTANKHTLRIKDKNGKDAFRMTMTAGMNGNVVWDGPYFDKDNIDSAFLSFQMVDMLDASHKRSNQQFLWKYPEKEDPVAAYVMAVSGFTWSKPPTREQLGTIFETTRKAHVEEARRVYSMEASVSTKDGSIEDMVKAQDAVEAKVAAYAADLESQMNTYLDIIDTDPSGLTPFEIVRIGHKEARDLKRRRKLAEAKINPTQKASGSTKLPPVGQSSHRSSSSSNQNTYLPPVSHGSSSTKSSGSTKGGGLPEVDEHGNQIHKGRKASALQEMTSIDGDALHDSFGEFLAKQMATGGMYGMYKSFGGYWDWATDTYKPTARKASVSLLFMLIRLLPASVMRGAMLSTVNTMVKRIRSPRPDDWPSPSEMQDIVEQLQRHIPDDKLKQMKGE